jgi:hypothetical protein
MEKFLKLTPLSAYKPNPEQVRADIAASKEGKVMPSIFDDPGEAPEEFTEDMKATFLEQTKVTFQKLATLNKELEASESKEANQKKSEEENGNQMKLPTEEEDLDKIFFNPMDHLDLLYWEDRFTPTRMSLDETEEGFLSLCKTLIFTVHFPHI